MPTPADIEAKFWDALKSDRTMMLGLHGAEEGHTRPMTAQFEGEKGGPIWFFTSSDNVMVQKLGETRSRAIANFASKSHHLFAAIHGDLRVDIDRAVIDRLWNRYVAAWYQGGKDDPKLVLLRLDPDRAEIWLDGSSIVAGIKMMLGVDPKISYRDNVAKVDLD